MFVWNYRKVRINCTKFSSYIDKCSFSTKINNHFIFSKARKVKEKYTIETTE